MPPRATSMTAKSTRGFISTIRADFGPDASALITRRSSMTTPSVDVIPTLRPKPLKMWAIIRAVVVRGAVGTGHRDDRHASGSARREQQVDHRLGDGLRLANG